MDISSEKRSNQKNNNIDKQKNLGKKTARERINLLIDSGSFEEIDQLVTSPFLEKKLYSDGVITGFVKINGKQVAVYSQDFAIKGGSLGKHHGQKICKIMDMAAKVGCPIIGIIDSGGARIDEGIHALAGFGEIFMRNVRYSGVIPQISVIVGPCAGGAVYSPALTDFIFATKKIGQMFITGPQVIKEVLHQEINKEDLGGVDVHSKKSGVVHFSYDSEDECFESLKIFLSYLPSNYLDSCDNPFEQPFDAAQSALLRANGQNNSGDLFIPAVKYSDSKNNKLSLLPENPNKSYDIKKIILHIVDKDSFFEVHDEFAKNIVVAFARICGRVVGIIANQPLFLAGAIDIDASCKAARFINFCNSFGIPIISFVDVPGFLPGVEQEHGGIIRHGAKLLDAYARATVPKITLILRKAFGGAYIVMGSKHLGADFVYAWPDAQIAVLGAKAAVSILHRKKLNKIEDVDERISSQKMLEEEYDEKYVNPKIAAEYGYIDGIIQTEKTREHLIRALDITYNKVEMLPKKKQANIPL